jgi:CDP-diacylglycerol--glycerol-3-phosphate 3-phosphatidyltransferase
VSGQAGASRTGRRPSELDAPDRPFSWTEPANAFTLLRVALVPVIAVLLFADGTAARWWAFGVFSVAAASDWFDGWVARRGLGTTTWGKLADPAADKLLIVGTLALLALGGEVSWLAVAVVVVREVAVTAQRSVLARRGVVMAASPYGKVKTVAQIVAIELYLFPPAPEPLADAALAVAVGLTIASGLEYVWRGRRLERAR